MGSDTTYVQGLIDTSTNLVEGRFNSTKLYTDQLLAQLQAYLDSLSNVEYDMPEFELDDTTFEEYEVGADYGTMPEAPEMPEITFDCTANITELTTQLKFDTPETVTMPSLTAAAPTPSFGNEPSSVMPADIGSPPNMQLNEQFVPEPPVSLPGALSLRDVTIPVLSEPDFPTWDGTKPSYTLTPPGNSFVYNEGAYTSPVRTALQTKLEDDITNGGTGLGTDVEAQIWANLRSREDDKYDDTYTKVLNMWASRGYTLPPGALAGMLLEVINEKTRNETYTDNEIAIEQARLAQTNTHHALTTSVQFEGVLVEHSNQIANRAFEAAKAGVTMGIEVYKAQVIHYNSQLDLYKTEAQVYQTIVQAAATQLEANKQRIETAKVESEIETQKVERYKGQVQAALAMVELYKARIQSYSLKNEAERLKLEVFKVKLETFIANVNAKTAGFELYKARVEGEKLKYGVYTEQVKAYVAEIDAKKAEYSIKVAEFNAKIDAFKQEVLAYQAKVEKYKAEVAGETAEVDANAKIYAAEADVFKAETQTGVVKVETQIKEFLGKIEQSSKKADLDIKKMELGIRASLEAVQIAVEKAKAMSNMYAQLTASAMGAVSATASLGASGSASSGSSHQHEYDEEKICCATNSPTTTTPSSSS